MNPKFYTYNSYYGRKIYTPFWNVMRSRYQTYDCGVDCDYLGPKNLMMGMFVYVGLAAIFAAVAIAVLCGKDKQEQNRHQSRFDV